MRSILPSDLKGVIMVQRRQNSHTFTIIWLSRVCAPTNMSSEAARRFYSQGPQAQNGLQNYMHLCVNRNKRLIRKIIVKEDNCIKTILTKRPNLVAIVGSFFHVWLFSISDAIWAIFYLIVDIMRRSNRNFNIHPPSGQTPAFDNLLCPGSGEFDLCLLDGDINIELEVSVFIFFFWHRSR